MLDVDITGTYIVSWDFKNNVGCGYYGDLYSFSHVTSLCSVRIIQVIYPCSELPLVQDLAMNSTKHNPKSNF
jgi:hypothetical protein